MTLYLARILIHCGLYFGKVHLDIVKNTLFKGPTEKVELSHRGLEHWEAWYLEHNALTTTEGIEEFLAIGLQLRLVVRVYEELLAIHYIGDVVLLSVVGDKPVNETQGYLGSPLEKLQNLVLIIATCVESL